MRNLIRSIRKGSVQWNEEDRLQMAVLLVKCGYSVRLIRKPIQGSESRKKPNMEYYIEYWEEDTDE